MWDKTTHKHTARNMALLAEAFLALQLKCPFGPAGSEDSHTKYIKYLPLLTQI